MEKLKQLSLKGIPIINGEAFERSTKINIEIMAHEINVDIHYEDKRNNKFSKSYKCGRWEECDLELEIKNKPSRLV